MPQLMLQLTPCVVFPFEHPPVRVILGYSTGDKPDIFLKGVMFSIFIDAPVYDSPEGPARMFMAETSLGSAMLIITLTLLDQYTDNLGELLLDPKMIWKTPDVPYENWRGGRGLS